MQPHPDPGHIARLVISGRHKVDMHYWQEEAGAFLSCAVSIVVLIRVPTLRLNTPTDVLTRKGELQATGEC